MRATDISIRRFIFCYIDLTCGCGSVCACMQEVPAESTEVIYSWDAHADDVFNSGHQLSSSSAAAVIVGVADLHRSAGNLMDAGNGRSQQYQPDAAAGSPPSSSSAHRQMVKSSTQPVVAPPFSVAAETATATAATATAVIPEQSKPLPATAAAAAATPRDEVACPERQTENALPTTSMKNMIGCTVTLLDGDDYFVEVEVG